MDYTEDGRINKQYQFQVMNKSIFITGVAGSGKSTVCQYLLDQGYNAIDLEEKPGLFASIDKESGQPVSSVDYDDLENVKQHYWICDKNKLRKF